MLAFVVKNLLSSDLETINKAIQSDSGLQALYPDGVTDPTPDYQRAIVTFLEWVILSRGHGMGLGEVRRLASYGRRLQQTLKRVFPDKSGKTTNFCLYKHVFACFFLLILVFTCRPR
jgi:hypothetical protein